ncbi:MAG TPA: diguanylate cyclase [Thermoanaerobaculia bacterium]|jgi:diguanylate cyclase (GGDEF)-like protein|nr:diguanylate cyclase [Thermoanaerobaculia bacterium]
MTPQRHQLEILNQIARIATLDLELRPMMQRITDALAHRFGWEFVALVMVDLQRKVFVCEAVTTTRETEIHPGYSRPLGSGVVGEVAATAKPILLDDVDDYPGYVETMRGTRAELCVPVLHREQLVAILNLESTSPGAFHDELPLLTTVAEQIAGAIHAARTHHELTERARLMEMMSEVSRTALEAIDLRDLLARIVRYVHERFPIGRASILLVEGEARKPVEAATAGLPPASDAAQLVVPIRFQQEVLGAFRLEGNAADAFSSANVLAFEMFANQVAGAIRLASANRLLDQRSRDLEEANAHLSRAIETLHRISTIDGLTGTANRRHFDDMFGLEWRRAARSRSPLSLLMIDIDHFKTYNDRFGHQAGDECLRGVADVLRSSVHRAADLVARYGGEEFVVLLPETDAEHAREMGERLREQVEQECAATISVGVATTRPSRDAADTEELIRRADAALYEAKRGGRNRVMVQ